MSRGALPLGRLSAFCAVVWLLCAAAFSGTAWAAGPYTPTECPAERFGGNLNCTANDVSINTITVLGSPPSSCVGDAGLLLNLSVSVNFNSPSRYNVGVFVSSDGKSLQTTPANGGVAKCTAAVLPTSSPFLDLDSNTCGDGNSGINGNTGQGTFTMSNVSVPCTTDGSGNTNMYIPYLVSWDQSSGTSTSCLDNTYPVPGTTSKCNTGTVTFPPGTTIVVLPQITIDDGVTSVRTGATVTYTIVITNKTASPLSNAIFTDPAVANLSVSSVTCSAGGGATCPASPTVTAMQGSGITLPTMPNNSTLTFTVVGTVANITSPATLTNTARVTVSGYSNSASDSDTIIVPPTVTKSFSPAAIAPGGASTLTLTLANPNSISIASVAFTDTYPTGMTNSATPGAGTTCTSGTVSAAANGATLGLSGATLAGGASCTVSAQVKATGGTGVNSVSVSSDSTAAGSGSATLLLVSATVEASPTSVVADGTSTSTITVTLKDAAGNALVGKTITLAPNSGTSSTITIVNATTDANGQAFFTVKDSVQEAVTYTATDSTDNIVIAQTATVTFISVNSFNAFETSTAAAAITGSIYTKLAGTAFGLDVVAISGSSPTQAQASGFSGNVKLELVANTGTVGSGYDATSRCPTSSTVIQTVASAAIASGRSTVNFAAVASAYRDVRVRISYPTSSPTIVVCSNDSFAIRPSAVTLVASPAMATPPSASATPTIKAGAVFTLQATTSPAAGYAGTLTQDTGRLTAQVTTQDTTVQGGGTVGTLTPTSLIANASAVDAGYTEVGYLYLAAGAFRDDGYTSVDQPSGCAAANSCDCVTNTASDAYLSVTLASGKYGCSIGSTATYSVGRFIPDHFETVVTGPMHCGSLAFTPACPTAPADWLVYSGQPFTTTVTAYRLGGTGATGIATNYAGSYARLVTLGAWNAAGGATQNPPAGGGGLTSNTIAATSFSNGAATTATPVYTFTAYPTAPTDIYLRASDPDGVTSLNPTPGLSVEGRIKVMNGRLHLLNSYGSELLPLRIDARAEYWDGSRWALNTQDSSTSFAAGAMNAAATGIGANTCFLTNPRPAAPTNASCQANSPAVTLAAGTGSWFVFDKTSPQVGFADLTLTVPTWLQGLWGGTTALPNQNPTARIKFGSSKAPYIYLRERY